ncbi:MAG: hypothetical protein KBT48_02865 [Firmicutes bacterium]|nr:hypothetical protein [Bacillota bacterium]
MKEHPKATPAEVVKALNLYDTDDVQTGHYLNIIDKKVTVTGFAVSKNNKRKIFGQVFFVRRKNIYE